MGNENSVGNPQDLAQMRKYTGMTIKHVLMIKDRLELLADEELTLDKASFSLAMKTKEEETNRIFGLFDLSNDGKIETLEFICALALLAQASLKDKCHVIFGLYDFDKNRTMTKNELIILVKTILTSLNAMCNRGECTILEAEQIATDLLNRYDTNKDASVSLKEFYSFVSKDPNILKMLLSYGLVSREDLRFNFGLQNNDIPEPDSELEEEIQKFKQPIDLRSERISLGIEHSIGMDDNINNKNNYAVDDSFEDEEEKALQSKYSFPWYKQVKDCVPEKYQDQIKKNGLSRGNIKFLTKLIADANPPAASLEITHIYGYRGFDTRNNLKYSSKNDLLYHCGAIAISLNTVKNQQNFFMEHTDDITCLDASDNYVVTGQVGRMPLLCLWDMYTMESKAVMKGFLKGGIKKISISNNQKLIAALDAEQCLAVYDVDKAIFARATGKKDESLVASGRGPKSEVFDIKFDKSDKTIIIACKCEVNFATFENLTIKIQKGIWEPKICPIQSVLTIGLLDSSVVTGTFRGQLIIWRGSRTSQSVDAHKGSILAMHTSQNDIKVITGGRDGFICQWDASLRLKQKIVLHDICNKLSNYRITAICENNQGDRLAIGTRGSDIIEILPNNECRIVGRGHYYGDLRGLCCHPRITQFFTVGEDSWLMKWSYQYKTLIQSVKLEYQSKTLDISSDCRFLAVGCHNGNILIMDPGTLNQLMDFKDRESEISCIKFSPDSDLLLAAYTHPYCEIFIYNTKYHFKKTGVVNGLNSIITSIDFCTTDYRLAMLAQSSQRLTYIDINQEQNPKIIHKGELQYKDSEFVTYNSIYGWHVQGIWPEISEGDDINSVDKAHNTNIIVTGDDYSGIKLFRFPSYMNDQSYSRYSGHSNKVSNVRFTYSDDYLVSLGGQEKSIILWKFQFDNQIQSDYDQSYITTDHQQKINKQIIHDDQSSQEEDQLLNEQNNNQKKQKNIGKQQKPFETQVKAMAPLNENESNQENTLTNHFLQLNYVFGVCHQFDNQRTFRVLSYTNTNKLVYPVAGIAVVQDTRIDPKTGLKLQSYFTQHTQDIISLVMHPKGIVAATGSATNDNQTLAQIMLWDTETKGLLCIINDFHLKAVPILQFSPDGTLLLTIGMDPDNSLAIYDWQAFRLLCTSKVDKSIVYDAGWKTNSSFMTTGEKHFKFWTVCGRNLRCQFANFKGEYEAQTAVSLAFGNECVSGSEKGNMILWKDISIGQKIKAHEGRINVLIGVKQVLFSGGDDGKIITWGYSQGQLQLLQVLVDMSKQSSLLPAITSIQTKNEQIAFITQDGTIYELLNTSPPRVQPLFHNPYGNINALAEHPFEKMFITGGDDRKLRVWDLEHKCELYIHDFDNAITSCDISSDGKFVITGDARGYLCIFEIQGSRNSQINLAQKEVKSTKFKQMKSSYGEHFKISQVKFSPNLCKVALGGFGGPSHVELYDIENGYKLTNQTIINIGFTSGMMQLDWSADSTHLAATSETYELKFISALKLRDVSPSLIRDIEWYRWTCIYGYQVQGIYPSTYGQDVASVCISPDKKFVVSGDFNGNIRLFKYPAIIKPIQTHRIYRGHRNQVSNIRFLSEKNMISVGKVDRAILIWSVEEDLIQQYVPLKTKEEELDRQLETQKKIKDMRIVSITEKKVGLMKFGKQKNIQNDLLQYKQIELIPDSSEEEVDLEEQKTSNYIYMKPWVVNVKEPVHFYKDPLNQNKAPKIDLQLEFAHGYRSNDCHNNVRYLRTGNILFHTACLGIVMDPHTNVQRFFTSHSDDIISMDLHPDGIRVATGEIGPNPQVYVWDSNTLQPLCTFSDGLTQGICSLNFSPSGEKLCVLCLNGLISIFIIDTKSEKGGSKITQETSGSNDIVEVKWKSDNQFISIGPYHFKLWTLTTSGLMYQTITIPNGVCGILMTSVINGDDIFLGDIEGYIQVWNKFKHQYHITICENVAVDALHLSKDFLIASGRDQHILIFDMKLPLKQGPLTAFKFNDIVKNAMFSEIRSIQLSQDSKSILIGTYGAEIWELSTKEQKLTSEVRFAYSKPIIRGHYGVSQQSEIWGLAFNQVEQDIYYTCGDDATLRSWSLSQKKLLTMIRTNLDVNNNEIKSDDKGEFSDNLRGRSIAVSPDGQFIVVGFKDGSIRIYDKDMKQKQLIRVAKEWVSDIKFSPHGEVIAIGSHDNSIYLFTFPEFKAIHKPLRKHSEFIMNIDFSCDGKKIHTTCGGYDLLFWDVTIPKQMPNGHVLLRDEHWYTWTSLLGWPVQGIWSDTSEGTDINCVDRSHYNYSGDDKPPDNYYFVVIGNDFNEIKIYRYPCIQRGSEFVIGKGHSSPISNVKWSNDDQSIISIGGEDMTILQWKVTKL